MLKKRKTTIFNVPGVLLVLIIIGCIHLYGGNSATFATGKIIDEVKCLDSSQSYSLYLPPGYTQDKKWPILFFLEAGGRFKLPLERFKEAAEKYGYILVCSRQFQDGPYEENNRAMLAMWQDAHKRFAIDLNRRYASGFSGGSRGASRLHVMTQNPLAGIIACGAGLDLRLKPGQIPPAFYIATIGLQDFNYKEMMKLDIALDEAGVEHIILVLEDDHRWPAVPVCTRTVEWLELQTMKKGTRPKDPNLVATLFQKELNIARKLESAGKFYQAARGYEACEILFKGLHDVTEAETGEKQVIGSKAFKTFQKEEERRNKEEWEYITRFARTAQKIEASAVTGSTLRQSKNDMGIPYLRKIIDKNKDIYDVNWAKRLLIEVSMKFSRAGRHYLEKGDYKRAILYLELVISATRYNAPIHFELAQAYALEGKKKEALENLRIAIEKGYKDLVKIREDRALDSLRGEKDYKDLIRMVKQQEEKD